MDSRTLLRQISHLALPTLILLAGCCAAPAEPTLTPSTSALAKPTPIPPTPVPATPTPSEIQEAFTWFDTLGFPDLTGRAYVRVATGRWRRIGDGTPTNIYVYAFLIEDKDTEFTVFTLDLRTLTLVRTPPGTEEHERIGYETLELHSEVPAYLEDITQARLESDESEWRIRYFGGQLGKRSELFVLARACDANGLKELAYEVCTFASTIYDDTYTGESSRRPFQEIVQDEITYAIMWRNVLAFADVSVSRQELLKRFDQFTESFPESEYTARARETAVILRQMVQEDEEHAQRARPLEAMTLDERIAELIFQLRDQNGHQLSQPGACDIFLDERGEDSPAHQLVEIGYPAVPQLITALEDQRFTRSVGFHRDFYFSHYVLRVGDAALAIIERIAGRSFYARHSTTSEMVKDGETSSVKAEVEAWWYEFQEKGEKQILIEAVESGDSDSPSQARLLVKRYPDAALEAITEGIRNAEDWWVHRDLVAAATELEGDEPIPLLLSVIDDSPYLSSRVVAADGLHRRGRPEGVAAMIDEWLEPGQVDPDEWRAGEELVEFLVGCGDPQAIRALGRDLHQRPIEIRCEVITTLYYHDRTFSAEGGDDCRDCESPEVAAAMEELFIHALDDTEECSGRIVNWDDNEPSYFPRICDFAGHALSQRWPDRYEFDPEVPSIERDRQLVELKNVWRTAKGLEPLPLPQRPQIPRVPDEVTRPLLDRIVQSPASEDQEAIEELEALGLGALPAVRELLDSLDEEHPARPVVAGLAARLANTVRVVVIEPDSVAPDRLLTEHLEAIEGKPLTSKAVVDLLLLVTRGSLPGSTGVKLRADRAGDDTGVTLSIRLIGATVPGDNLCQEGWNHSKFVAVNNEFSLHSGGHMSCEYGQTDDAYENLVEALDAALEAPPEEMLMLRLSITQRQSQPPMDSQPPIDKMLLAGLAALVVGILVTVLWWRKRKRAAQQVRESTTPGHSPRIW